MQSKTAIIVAIVLLVILQVALSRKPTRYTKCLFNCKNALGPKEIPTSCFESCSKNSNSTKSLGVCSVPILNLACRKAPIAPRNSSAASLNLPMSEQIDAPVSGEALWNAYHAELLKFLTKGQMSTAAQNFAGLQLVSTPFPAEWDNNDAAFQILANRRTGFTKLYEPSLQLGTFDGNYCDDFVPNLDFQLGIAPQTEQRIKELYAQQDDLLQDVMREEIRCEDKYMSLNIVFRNRYGSFANYAAQKCDALKQLSNQAAIIKGQIEYLYNQNAGSRKDIEARSSVLKCRGNKARRWMELNPLKDWMANINGGRLSPFSVEVNQYSFSSTAKSSFRSMGLNLFVVSFNMANQKRELTTSVKDFKLQISAKGYQAIHIAPEPQWFNGDVFSHWRNGPFRNGKSTGSFFGEGGSISLLPRTFYLVYQPVIELSLNAKDAEEFEKKSSFSISLSISFVSFQFGQSRSVSKFKENENLYRIRIEDNSPTPQVIAVNNIVL